MIISYVSTLTFISFLVNLLSKSLINVKSIAAILIFIILAVIFLKSQLFESIENIIERIVEESRLWTKLNSRYINFITKHKG